MAMDNYEHQFFSAKFVSTSKDKKRRKQLLYCGVAASIVSEMF